MFTLSIIHQVNDTTTYTIYIQPSLIILLVHGFSLFISLFKWQRLTIKEETIVLIMANVAWSLYTQYKFAIRELFLIAARERNRHAEIFYIVLAIQSFWFWTCRFTSSNISLAIRSKMAKKFSLYRFITNIK